jgi:hypothetical protein
MRPDKIVARILLVFSVANVALAAPAVVRQRHLDVAKAASEKRAPGSDNGATGEVELAAPSSTTPLEEQHPVWKWLNGAHSGAPLNAEPEWTTLGPPEAESERSPLGTPGAEPERSPLSTPGVEPERPLLSPPEADRFISDSLKHKALLSAGAIGVLGATAGVAYGINKLINHLYVSPLSSLSCGHQTESQTF